MSGYGEKEIKVCEHIVSFSDLTTHGLLEAEVSGAAACAVTGWPVVLWRAEVAHVRCGIPATQVTAAEN